MSKYKMGFRIQVGRHGEKEIVDLVDDYGYTEEEAKEIIADSDKQFELYTEWRSENADQEYWVEESGQEEWDGKELEEELDRMAEYVELIQDRIEEIEDHGKTCLLEILRSVNKEIRFYIQQEDEK